MRTTLPLFFLALFTTSAAMAGTHKLTSATDTSTDVVALCPGWGTVRVEMVEITSAMVAGGQDATAISVTLEGTISAEDIALVSVLYNGAVVNTAPPPQVGAPFTISLPATQKGGAAWTVALLIAETGAGKSFRLTVNSITGTSNTFLPISTAGRNIGTPTCE